jgi:hypothetical protein
VDVLKKRVASGGQGKRGGPRTLLAYQAGNKVFFVYGFAKNVKSNISKKELLALKHYASQLLSYTAKELKQATKAGELVVIEGEENKGKSNEKINTGSSA